MRKLFILLIVFSAAISHAELILHVYSPWADSSLVDSAHYVTGAFSDWGKSTSSLMTSEGDGYFVYVIDDEITSDSWYTITIKAGGSTWGASPKVTEVFGQETEVWLIPLTDSTYKISLMPTHSKIVWFKSPWGNKKIPNLIAGTDTLRMHPGDSDHCGWFWGALQDEDTSLTFVYFQKKHTEETLPTTGSVDISAITSGSDSVYIDGTVTTLEASALIGDLGTCFDSNYVIHVLNPWDDDSDLRHLQLMMYISNNRLNNDTMDTDDMDGWYKETLADTLTIRSSDYVIVKQCSTYAQYNNYTQSMEDLFPIGEYEAWLLPSGDSTFRILWNIDLRYITLMSPWDDAVPNLVYNDDTLLMRRLTDTCGWYRRAIYEYTGSWSMHFLEGYGTELYTMSGLEDGDDFVLDSILENNEMVWLRPNPYPAGQPVATTSFPEVLGDCPTRSLAVVVYDWAGETTKDTTVDHDFGGTWVNETADDYNGCGGLVTGMVEDTLGSNGLPLRNLTSFPEANCTYAEDLNSWFVAWDTVVSSDTLTNATCYDIPLELDEAGFWVADFAVDTAEKIPGFFPVDDFRYLDEDETVLNPKFDSLTSSSYSWFGYHNYSFSMHVNATFTYIKGQYFQFRGDDDVWVFINNKLVVDLGGVHNPATGTVDLDTLGLAQGEAYDFHIFYAERNCCGSNFMMRTSINLQTVRTYYPVQIETDDGTIAYDIKQIRQEQSLACDFSSEASVDTVDAASTFLLTGPQFSGDTVTLSAGVNYGGITINSTYTGFTIDTTAIVASRTLAPGTYTLIFSLSTDATQSSKVTFVVPTYPLPTISFADSAWSLIDPSSDTSIVLGEWAFVPYKVNVQALYVGINCEDCSEELTLSTSDSLVFCLDSLCSQYTTTVTLDSGRVSFWVMGLTAVDSASFTVSSTSVENELVWAGLTFKEPPVPYARSAAMYDRDGDGMADSLILTYTASIQDDDAPDSLSWVWGDNTSHLLDSAEIAGFLANDTQAVLVDDSLVGFIATGNTDGTEYSGSSQTWFTYTASDGQDSGQVVPFVVTVPVEDHVAPVILSAEIAPGEDKLDTLYLELSESLADNVNDFDSLFTLHLWRNGVESSSEAVYFYGVRRAEGSKFILMYRNSASVYPTVGDSVRLTPLIGQDVSGNFASINNPWVAITGRQRGLIETVGLVDYDDATAPSDTSPTVRVVAAASSQTVEDLVAQEGVPGFLIRFDLGNVVENLDDADPEDVVLYFDTWFFTNLGQYVNNAKDSISCADAIFNGDCTKYSYNIFVGWNLRSSSGRLAATGAYIAKMKFVVKAQGSKVEQQDSRQMWGLRRK